MASHVQFTSAMLRLVASALFATLGVLGLACSSDPTATTTEANITKPFGDGADASVPVGRSLDLSACATSSSSAENVPVYLAFVFDRSTSMLDTGKWDASKAALTSFFTSSVTLGINASLQFFPLSKSCSATPYATPAVAMHALPDDGAFASALDATTPDGETPTLPALTGAMTYAKNVRASIHDGGRVAVVLVTDGEPNGCASTIDSVAKLARDNAKDVPLYVIGVGSNLAALNPIAEAGGTKVATLVRTSSPDALKTDFAGALDDIRKTSSCDVRLPTPPDGKVLDTRSVNVVLRTSEGDAGADAGASASTTLAYDQACASGGGWHYDDAMHPSRIELCANSCSDLRKKQGRVDTVLGCATIGDVPK